MNFKALPFFLIAFITLSFTQSTLDECKPYFPMQKGTTWVYNELDKKGELAGTSTTIVKDISSNGDKIEYILTGIHDGPKKKEKNHYEKDIIYTCENGVFKFNMDNMIPQETMDSFGEEMTIDMTQTEMEFPSSMAAGDQLKDASISIAVSMGSISVMNMTVNITNRKVEKIEDVTTAAGTYSCALMTYDVSTKMGFATTNSSVKDWYSNKVGIVKSESYDKKGELESSRELVEYKAGS